MAGETDIGGSRRGFPRTQWSRVLAAGGSEGERREALAFLCERYWRPLYFYARRKGLGVEQAKDLVQGFLARLVERDAAARLDPARGRLRGYLKRALDNHLANEWERESAAKRGGGAARLALDFEAAENELEGAAEEPGAALDREWALALMERALERLKAEFDDGTRKGDFELVRRFFRDAEPPSYAEAAAGAGISEPALKSFLHRARARYGALVREEVAATVDDPSDVERELAELVSCLGAR